MTVLSDDLTLALEAVVQRLSNTPMIDRMAVNQDLGEELVIAHAVVQAEAGNGVVMLTHEIRGAATATREIKRLERRAAKGHAVGSLSLYSTLTVLKTGIWPPYMALPLSGVRQRRAPRSPPGDER